MTLFHYCSTDAFYNMIAKRSIWLSSLSASNDTQEGRWLSHALAKACRTSGMKADEVDRINFLFQALEGVMDCYGFCLSSKRDMLSQWRGYGLGLFGRDQFEVMADRLAKLKGNFVLSIKNVPQQPES